MSEQKMIMYDSPEAAQRKTVVGWVSSAGNYFGANEHLARYDGCTHRQCDCGEIYPRSEYCRACHNKHRDAVYESMPLQEWADGPACIFDDDVFFWDHEEFFEWCKEDYIEPASVRLVLCKREAWPILGSDFFEEYIPDGEDADSLPKAILDAIDAFNAVVAAQPAISWYPANVRVDMAKLMKDNI